MKGKRGWFKHPVEHGLAAKGIKTVIRGGVRSSLRGKPKNEEELFDNLYSHYLYAYGDYGKVSSWTLGLIKGLEQALGLTDEEKHLLQQMALREIDEEKRPSEEDILFASDPGIQEEVRKMELLEDYRKGKISRAEMLRRL